MSTSTSPSVVSVPAGAGAWRPILWGGLISGVLDITAAFVNAGLNGIGPGRILRGIASALLGAAARDGGWTVAALGLGMHFCIATGWTALFYQLSRRWPALLRQPFASGLGYGVVVYLGMMLVVLPFGSWFRSLYLPTPAVYAPRLEWLALGIILVCVGLPIAYAVRRFSGTR